MQRNEIYRRGYYIFCAASIRSGDGPEFTSRRMLGWAEERKISLVHMQPGRPLQNGHIESCHGRLRDEYLNVSWFRTRNDVRRPSMHGATNTTPDARTVRPPTERHGRLPHPG